MPAIKCPNCGRNYSNTLKECPYCKTANPGSGNTADKKTTPDTKAAQAPIHTRNTVPQPEKKAAPQQTQTQAPKAVDEAINKTSNAELEARLKKLEEENKKLKEEAKVKEQEAIKEASKEKDESKTSSSAPIKNAENKDKKNDETPDENFDRIMHPEKYTAQTTTQKKSILDKVSGAINEAGASTISNLTQKKTNSVPQAVQTNESDVNDESEEFDNIEPSKEPEVVERKFSKTSSQSKPVNRSKTIEDAIMSSNKLDDNDDNDDFDEDVEQYEEMPVRQDTKEYDPNYDHYYDDVLPELLAEKDRIPKETIIRTAIMIAACAIAVLVAAYRLV